MAHPDLNALLNDLLSRAKRLLSELGEFYPFGSTMAADGKIAWYGAYDGRDRPPSQPLIDMMTRAFHDKAGSGAISAASICYDVRTIPPGQTGKCDAVCMAMEHQSGESVEVYAPYRKTASGSFEYGQLFASRRTPQFFVHKKGSDPA